MDRDNDVNNFWNIVERKMAIIFPQYLRNILKLRGYDNATTVRAITNEDIEEKFEKFAKTDMKNHLPENYKPEDYFSYYGGPEEFHITPGHKVLLKSVAKFVKEMTIQCGIDYFNFYVPLGSKALYKRVRTINWENEQKNEVENFEFEKEKEELHLKIKAALENSEPFLKNYSSAINLQMIDIFIDAGKLVSMIKCPICSYSTRLTGSFPLWNLKRHIRGHESKSVIENHTKQEKTAQALTNNIRVKVPSKRTYGGEELIANDNKDYQPITKMTRRKLPTKSYKEATHSEDEIILHLPSESVSKNLKSIQSRASRCSEENKERRIPNSTLVQGDEVGDAISKQAAEPVKMVANDENIIYKGGRNSELKSASELSAGESASYSASESASESSSANVKYRKKQSRQKSDSEEEESTANKQRQVATKLLLEKMNAAKESTSKIAVIQKNGSQYGQEEESTKKLVPNEYYLKDHKHGNKKEYKKRSNIRSKTGHKQKFMGVNIELRISSQMIHTTNFNFAKICVPKMKFNLQQDLASVQSDRQINALNQESEIE